MMSRAAIEWEKLNHIEISAFQTGAGMAVDPTIAGAKAGADARTPEEAGQWTAPRGVKPAAIPDRCAHGLGRDGQRAGEPLDDRG
jgi:hypothetical protein